MYDDDSIFIFQQVVQTPLAVWFDPKNFSSAANVMILPSPFVPLNGVYFAVFNTTDSKLDWPGDLELSGKTNHKPRIELHPCQDRWSLFLSLSKHY